MLNGLSVYGGNNTVSGDSSTGTTFYNNSGAVTVCAGYSFSTQLALGSINPPSGCDTSPGNTINLTAPPSGDYAGILFFQNSNDSSEAIIIGSDPYGVGTTYLEGALYFPDAPLVLADLTDGPNWQETYTILDTSSLLLLGTVKIGSDYPPTLPRSFFVRQAVLVE